MRAVNAASLVYMSFVEQIETQTLPALRPTKNVEQWFLHRKTAYADRKSVV